MDSVRVAGVVALGTGVGFLAGSKGRATEMRWQIDPDKCIGCGKCATNCVLDESAVRCVQCFDMCGYCDICTGYLDTQYQNVDTAAENQLCPTGAIVRTLIEEKAGQRFYEYTITSPQCIGCGVCVKGCALMNGSLYLQVMHDSLHELQRMRDRRLLSESRVRPHSAETPYRVEETGVGLDAAESRRSGQRSLPASFCNRCISHEVSLRGQSCAWVRRCCCGRPQRARRADSHSHVLEPRGSDDARCRTRTRRSGSGWMWRCCSWRWSWRRISHWSVVRVVTCWCWPSRV